MKKYEEYKDSGVGLIGDIPKHWEKIKIKYISTIYGRIGFRGYTVNDIVDEGEGAITLSPSNILKQKLILDKKTYLSWQKYEESPEIKIYNNDVILVKTGSTVGKVAYIEKLNHSATLNPQLIVFKKVKINSKFLYYHLISQNIQNLINLSTSGSVIPTLTQNEIGNYEIVIPKLNEQEKIVKYLDEKILQIEELINKKEELIENLDISRQKLILETVTKGLNKDISMKSSGVEWLEKIPSHWRCGKITYYSKLVTGGTPNREYIDYWENGDINWMSSGEINKEIIYEVNEKITSKGLRNSNATLLPINTVMIALNGQGKTKGKVAIIKVETTCNQSLGGFICDEINLHYKYLYYFLKSKYKEIRGLVGDGLRDGLSLKLLNTLKIQIPPIKEQIEIGVFLDRKVFDIEKIILKTEEQIEILKKAKEKLITEVVTGKIDVRDYKLD